MKVHVLHVPDCPNADLLLARLDQALTGTGAVKIQQTVVHDQAEATSRGMTGSPTMLVDGVDPFAATPAQPASMSCRLYVDEAGARSGTPSVKQLRAALADALTRERSGHAR